MCVAFLGSLRCVSRFSGTDSLHLLVMVHLTPVLHYCSLCTGSRYYYFSLQSCHTEAQRLNISVCAGLFLTKRIERVVSLYIKRDLCTHHIYATHAVLARGCGFEQVGCEHICHSGRRASLSLGWWPGFLHRGLGLSSACAA